MYTDNPEQDAQDFINNQTENESEFTQEEIDEARENFLYLMRRNGK